MSVRIVSGLPRSDDGHRASTDVRASVRVIDGARYQAKLDAEAAIARANERAAEIVSIARAESDALRARALEEGKAAGLVQAMGILNAARAEQAALLDRSVDLVLAASRATAERALGEAIALDDAKLTRWAAEAIAGLRGARRISLHAHPAALARLSTLAAQMPMGATLRLVEEPALPAGTLVVRTELGEITVELSSQVEALVSALREPVAAELRMRQKKHDG